MGRKNGEEELHSFGC